MAEFIRLLIKHLQADVKKPLAWISLAVSGAWVIVLGSLEHRFDVSFNEWQDAHWREFMDWIKPLIFSPFLILVLVVAAILVHAYLELRKGRGPSLQSLPSSTGTLTLAVRTTETVTQSQKREMVDVTPEYLTGFYRQGHTSVQAKKLAEAFIGKWIKVSGPLGDVLGNYETFRMVVFSNRSSHTHDDVNMYFRDKERFGQLSTLKRGDTITAVGRLSEINSLEIWLEDCVLVDS
jgi:hypothetical protein